VGALFLLSTVASAATALAGGATCLGVQTTIDGTPGDDRIVGTRGADVVAAFAGSDVVYGRGGDDRLCGGRGRDVLLDGPGRDVIDGGDGMDLLYLCPDGLPDRWTRVERVTVSTRACI
jgi:Ca2+-binding RTX toxin-like protein